jgi:hypothetical protein
MESLLRQRVTGSRPLSPLATVAIALSVALALALTPTAPRASAEAGRIVPASGSYKASGRGDPPAYAVRAQVKTKASRLVFAAQIEDTCGGFAIAHPAISRSHSGAPVFTAQVGGASIRGRWTSSTSIKGTVKTPCAARQGYVLHVIR